MLDDLDPQPFGMDADLVGVQSGVTAVIDQGGPSCMTLPGFRQFIAEPAKSRVYAFLSAYLVFRRPEKERLAYGLLVASVLLTVLLFSIATRTALLPGMNY